jgi:hypothetical protein
MICPETSAAAISSLPTHPWLDRYLEHLLVEKGLSENSLSSYASDLRLLLGFLEKRDCALEDVNKHAVYRAVLLPGNCPPFGVFLDLPVMSAGLLMTRLRFWTTRN